MRRRKVAVLIATEDQCAIAGRRRTAEDELERFRWELLDFVDLDRSECRPLIDADQLGLAPDRRDTERTLYSNIVMGHTLRNGDTEPAGSQPYHLHDVVLLSPDPHGRRTCLEREIVDIQI